MTIAQILTLPSFDLSLFGALAGGVLGSHAVARSQNPKESVNQVIRGAAVGAAFPPVAQVIYNTATVALRIFANLATSLINAATAFGGKAFVWTLANPLPVAAAIAAAAAVAYIFT